MVSLKHLAFITALVVVRLSGGVGGQQLSPPSGCQAAAPLPSSRLPVEVTFTLLNNHVHVPVCRGGRALSFVLDTGAPMSIVDLQTARQMGLTIEARMQARGAGAGVVAGARLRPDRVVLAGTGVVVPLETAIDFSGISTAEGTPIEGILGADFIRRFVVEIDYPRQRLRLHDRDTFAYAGSGGIVPITFLGNYIQTRATITVADGGAVEALLLVDVGSSLALSLAHPFVEAHRLRDRLGPTIRRPSGRGVGGTATADIGRVANLRIGDVTIQRPITGLYHEDGGVFATARQGDGNLGADILRRFVVYLDYTRSRLLLERHAGTDEPFETDMSGLAWTLQPGGTSLQVDFVVPGSPAAEAGIRPGDLITRVETAAVSASTPESLKARFRRPGDRVTLTIRRNGVDLVAGLITRRLV